MSCRLQNNTGSRRWQELEIFDLFNTVFISAALIVTIPFASFVYYKLLFRPPYAKNYTFILIVFNGTSELLTCFTYLFVYQLTTFVFAHDFYEYITVNNIGNIIRSIDYFVNGLGFHSAFCIAINRLRTILFYEIRGSDAKFFFMSLCLCFLLSTIRIIDLFVASLQYYRSFDLGYGCVYLPSIITNNIIFRTISDIEIFLIVCSTFIVNVVLGIIIIKKRKMNAEKGLIITSLVSYIFYTLYYVNGALGRYFSIKFCGYAQFLFLGLACMTPFWCLLLFTSSVRRFVFNIGIDNGSTTVQTLNRSHHLE